MAEAIHNPDQFMLDLRQLLAQGRKTIGILLGGGGPASIHVDPNSGLIAEDGQPLIPTITGLTAEVLSSLDGSTNECIGSIVADLGGEPNIEQILSRIRGLADTIAASQVFGLDGPGYQRLSEEVCAKIGKIVKVQLPEGATSYLELVGWIGGTPRDHAVEVFTTNYDLLLEEAFEQLGIPYFDGFVGSREPFFDVASILGDSQLPSRWARVWKLHGSLGWDTNGRGDIVRTGTGATHLIYPTHLKYDQTQKLPYTALIDRLRQFLQTPDSLLLAIGFSFNDAHLAAVIDESLSANKASAVIALQFGSLDDEGAAVELARRRTNFSVYARNGAVINGVAAEWRLGTPPHPEWIPIRENFWSPGSDSAEAHFKLGDFTSFARFVALTRAEQVTEPSISEPQETES